MTSIFTLLWRDLRAGELNILIFSLILATATVTSISLFTSRIQNSILDEATEFLAADAQVRSTLPIKDEITDQAQHLDLETALLASFRAMAFSDTGMQLVSVKAATQQYPLKGAVTLANAPFGESYTVTRGPAQGEIWLAPRLFSALEISPGAQVTIGDAHFTVSAVLVKEPDSPQSFFGVAPRAIMHYNDIQATGAVQVGSRVNHTLLLKGSAPSLKALKEYLVESLDSHTHWVGVQDGNRNVGDALQRAEKFLLLAGSLSVLLSGVAIALAARRYAIRQSTNVALLKTFGQTPAQITKRYLTVLLVLGASSVLVGSIIGWLLHWIILQLLSAVLPSGLVAASAQSFITGALAGFVTLFAFAAPPLLSLRHVAPAAVLRQDSSSGIIDPRIAALIGFVSINALVLAYSQDLMITGVIAIGGLITLAGGSLLAWLILTLGKWVSAHFSNAWRLGIANLKRHQGFNAIQIVIFSTLIMLLLILIDTRTSLIYQWQKQIPEDTPNHFIFNIFNDDKPVVKHLLDESNIQYSQFYPMMRGRLTEVNGDSIAPRVEQTESHMNYERELNLTWATALGGDNTVVAGSWHSETDTSIVVSAEEEYAKGIGLKVGDSLTFSITGQQVIATLGSIRSVQWDSMNPNFYMIFNQPLLDNTATNWMTSFHLPKDQKIFVNSLTRKVPTASVIELDQMIRQVQNIIGQVSIAIEFILLLVLVAGILVLITSVQATLDIRFQESAILRTLGAKRRLVSQVLIIEFSSLGFMAGLLGAFGAQLSLYFLQTKVFQLTFEPSLLIMFLGPISGALLIGIIGWLSTRKVTHQPPLTILRSLQ